MIQLAALGLPAPFGILAVSLYLTLGVGFPVFSNGGGISYFSEITGGYLVGFWIATFLCQILQKKIILLAKYSFRANSAQHHHLSIRY